MAEWRAERTALLLASPPAGTSRPSEAVAREWGLPLKPSVLSIRLFPETPCFTQQALTEHLLYMEVGPETTRIQTCLRKIDSK